MRKIKIIGIHIFSFVILIVILVFVSEPLLNQLASGIHNVEMWLNLMLLGTIGIVILTIISCMIFLKKGYRKKDKSAL